MIVDFDTYVPTNTSLYTSEVKQIERVGNKKIIELSAKLSTNTTEFFEGVIE